MPWSFSGFSRKKRWFHSPWPWVGVAVVIGLGFLALPFIKTAYHGWNEQRRMKRGENAMQAGDFRRALINAQIVLARNPRSIPANQLAARALEGLKSPDVIHVRRRLDALTGDPENALTLIEDNLKANDPAAAARLLAAVPEERRNHPRFHALSARVAAARKDTDAAEKHWQEAARLEPGNENYRLEVARLQVNSRTATEREAAADTLAKLSENPTLRLPALRALLANAASFRERSRAREFADRLVADPEATFADRISRLTVLHTMAPLEFPTYLAELQKIAVEKPEDVYVLLSWMNVNNQALLVPEWEPQLPAEALARPQVKAALAEAYARASNWEKLRERLSADEWQDLEFLRFAYLARTTERLDDESASLAAWGNAVNIAQDHPRRLETLARTCFSWGWSRRGDEVLWKLAPSRYCPRWVADRLWATSMKARDTTRMLEASRVLLKAEPHSVPIRNNYIALSLLTGQTADEPHRLATELYVQNPTNAIVVTTYGLSLLLQNRPWEALALTYAIPTAELHQNPVAFYHGLFLSAAGQKAEAEPFLSVSTGNTMLPEEQALLARFLHEAAPVVVVGSIDRSRTDTVALYKEARQHFLDDSRSVPARTNYILLAFLTRQSVDSARQLIRPLHKDHPQNPEVAIAYGYSLFEQDRPADAVAALASLPPAQLEEPVRAAYFGTFLAAAGDAEKARKYLDLAEKATLLPEEKALLTKARASLPAP